MVADITFIIPVHNTQNYLDRCFNSVFDNETAYKYELVVVDDASTDESLSKIKEIEARKPQNCTFKIVHLDENVGVQKARFVGLESATGKYVFFLDSDDEISICFIDDVVSKMNDENLDILLINSLVKSGDQSFDLIPEPAFGHAVEYGPHLESLLFGDFGFICSHIFRKSLLDKADLKSLPHLAFMEDLNFYIEITRENVSKTGYLNKNLYVYYQDKNWHVEKMNESKADDSIYVIKKRYDEIKEHHPEHLELWRRANLNTVLRLIHSVKKTDNISKQDKKKIVNKIYSYDFVKETVNITFKQFMKLSLKDKIRYILYK